MTPLSEADPDIALIVRSILGACSCGPRYVKHWVGEAKDKRDPACAYHRFGEEIAALARDRRKWRKRTEHLQALTGATIVYRD